MHIGQILIMYHHIFVNTIKSLQMLYYSIAEYFPDYHCCQKATATLKHGKVYADRCAFCQHTDSVLQKQVMWQYNAGMNLKYCYCIQQLHLKIFANHNWYV